MAESPKRLKYDQVIVGEWYRPTKHHIEKCCDCGLVHELQYKVVDGEVHVRVKAVKRPHRKAARATRRA